MTDAYTREREWLQALNFAFLDFRGEIAGDVEYTPNAPNLQPLYDIIRRDLPEKAAERLIGLLNQTDKFYAYKITIQKHQRNLQRLDTDYGRVFLAMAVQDLVDTGLSVSAAVDEVSVRENVDISTIWRAWSMAK